MTRPINKASLWHLVAGQTGICDICGKPRSSGNNTYKHTRCSKTRQAHFAHKGELK